MGNGGGAPIHPSQACGEACGGCGKSNMSEIFYICLTFSTILSIRLLSIFFSFITPYLVKHGWTKHPSYSVDRDCRIELV